MESSVFSFVAHSIQKKLWPHGTRAATTSEVQQIIQSFFLEATLLLLVESMLVGERGPIIPFTLEISPFIVEVVVGALLELLEVPIGAVEELVNREKEPRLVLGGREGNIGSLAILRAVV